MTKFFTLLALLSISTSARFLVAAHNTFDSEIEQLASATGQNITGLRKSEGLLMCLKAGNCAVHRYGESSWRTQLTTTPQATEPRKRQTQCSGRNTHGTIGRTQMNYGTVNPADAFKSVSSICSQNSCDTASPSHLDTSIVATAGMANAIVTTTVDGDYPDTNTRDAMIAVAVQAASQNAKQQYDTYYVCSVGGRIGGCKSFSVLQNYDINFIAVDIYGTDSALHGRLHITVTVQGTGR